MVKVSLIGHTMVGKSSFCDRLIFNKFYEGKKDLRTTFGIRFSSSDRPSSNPYLDEVSLASTLIDLGFTYNLIKNIDKIWQDLAMLLARFGKIWQSSFAGVVKALPKLANCLQAATAKSCQNLPSLFGAKGIHIKFLKQRARILQGLWYLSLLRL